MAVDSALASRPCLLADFCLCDMPEPCIVGNHHLVMSYVTGWHTSMATEKQDENRGKSATGTAGQLVQVAVPVPAKRGQCLCYDYDAALFAPLGRGQIVKVPLGSRHVWAIVMDSMGHSTIAADRLKQVAGVADVPPVDEKFLQFLEDVASWTLAPFGTVMRLLLNTPEALVPPPEQTLYGPAAPLPPSARLTPQRQRVLTLLAQAPAMSTAEIAREAGVAAQTVSAMADAGLLVRHKQARASQDYQISSEMMVERHRQLILSPAQQAVAQAMQGPSGQTEFNVHLLDGVTGSGKTETYFDLVARAVAGGRQVLILLPEIALTTAWQDRFIQWFGFAPALWHSAVTPARRRVIWRQAITGQPLVVAGARSALFLPFTELGLIIVDEEHDASYKQEDQLAYHARDMAILRARRADIPIIVASATPALESWVNAGAASSLSAGHPRWHHHVLDTRFGAARLPDIQLIDMRLSRPPRGQWLSPDLVQALSDTLTAGDQSLLFLNRRGYAPMTVCGACGHRLCCHQCDSLLVTHRLAGNVQCHFCGISQPIINDCPSCAATDSLHAVGPGVERLEEEVRQLFSQARIAVLSSDTLKSAAEAEELFTAMARREIDILIGTQMAAKGHHFPNLTLVGVVDADLGLGGGDLRAAERTYQMLWQVAGRSGRGTKPGRALIQTFQPAHRVLAALSAPPVADPSRARNAFMQAEAEARYDAGMPPFGRLAALIISGADITAVEGCAQRLSAHRPNFANVDILGPAPAPVSRMRGAFRMRFLIRADKNVALQTILREWLEAVEIPAKVRVVCDIDPYSFM